MTKLQIQQSTLSSLKKRYAFLPKNSMEFGGILCGNETKNQVNVKKFVDVPSVRGSQDLYLFNTSVLRSSLCTPYNIVGIWHTHPSYSPFPSDGDRQTSKKLNKVGCVLTDSLQCFSGEKDVPLKIDI